MPVEDVCRVINYCVCYGISHEDLNPELIGLPAEHLKLIYDNQLNFSMVLKGLVQ
jgi:hypothetical protein